MPSVETRGSVHICTVVFTTRLLGHGPVDTNVNSPPVLTHRVPVFRTVDLGLSAAPPTSQLGLQGPDAGHGLIQLASQVPDSVGNPASCTLKPHAVIKYTSVGFLCVCVKTREKH